MAVSAKVKKYIDQLIKGLEQHGKYYNISSRRFYNSREGHYSMSYTLEDLQDRSVKMRVNNKSEILKYLVREWCRETGQPVPEACLEVLDGGTNKKDLGVPVFKKFQRKSPSKK